ncbi:kinase-like domain-containing protein [Thelephora terrestris]|uniref:Kinase-like domain-containing protein n=1 Tax=Thelephora terrestris TaxID=56493 RepID=A0A9P6L3X3_9AGAM|nr:kinase-like domain-containing protein [Thelephora terrestris]
METFRPARPRIQDYPPLLNSFLDDKVDRKATTSLEDEDAIVCLDILAKILERVRNLENLSNHVLRVFQSLAYKAASGGFSDVRKGSLGGHVVAVKVLRMAQNSNVVKLQKDFCKEAVLWKSISHPNVLGLIAVDIDGSTGRCFMVSELMGNGNIFEFIQRNSANRLRLTSLKACTTSTASTSSTGHQRAQHPDHNATPPQACLSDFGFSIPAPTNTFPLSTCGMNLGGGTPPYMAPELIRPSMFGLSGSEASREGDIFAFGMAIYEVVTGVRPFSLEGKRVQELIFAVTEGERPKKPENAEAIGFGNGIWNLVEKCWSQDRKQRPSTRDVRLRLTFAASTSSSAPPGPRVAVSQARTVSTRSTLFTSYGE